MNVDDVIVYEPVNDFRVLGNGKNCPMQVMLTDIKPYILSAKFYEEDECLILTMTYCNDVFNFFNSMFVDSYFIDIYVKSTMYSTIFNGLMFKNRQWDVEDIGVIKYVFKSMTEPIFSLVNIGEALDVPEYI